MQTLSCTEVEELIPAYALDALDPGEQAGVAEHLAACPSCVALAGEYRELASMLAEAVPQVVPPSRLRTQLLDSLGPLPQEPAASVASLTRVSTRPRAWLNEWTARLAAVTTFASTAAAVVLLVMTAGLRGELARQDEINRQLVSQLAEAQSAAALFDPAQAVAVNVEGTQAGSEAHGRLIVNPEGNRAILVVYGLPQLPPGQAYQLWLNHDGERDSGGVFKVDSDGYGVLLVRAPHQLRDYRAVGVTNEPEGGSPGPTGTRVLATEF